MEKDQGAGNGSGGNGKSEAATAQKFTGGCHCGAVRFEASLNLSHTVSCNCSICSTKGLILAFTPVESFTLASGDMQLREYRFNRHVISHLFCETCGVQAFSRATTPEGKAMVAVNVRALEGVDPATLTPSPFDGRSA